MAEKHSGLGFFFYMRVQTDRRRKTEGETGQTEITLIRKTYVLYQYCRSWKTNRETKEGKRPGKSYEYLEK